MIKHTDKEFIIIPMEPNMREDGSKICSMVKVKKPGLMEHATLASI